MNKITPFLLIVITALSLVLVSTAQSKASNKNFSNIVPFMSSSDRLGFFDQSNGHVYMYDSNFSQCIYQGQVTALGKPIQALTK